MAGYGEWYVFPEINADHFEIKTNLLQLVQANPFHGLENENPHAHINSFKRITSTLRFRNVPNDVIKLMMFPYSLEGAAKTWINTTSRETVSKTNEGIDKLADQLLTLVEIVFKKVVTPALIKAVEETCVTCDALFLMPRFAPTIRNLLMNKEKLLELAKIPFNENCSAMLLKKLLEKLGDPVPLSYRTLVVVDLKAASSSTSHTWKILLGFRSGRALIDVYGEEITLLVDNEAITFNLDQTTRYSSTNDKSVNRIDIIDEVYEEYALELLGFSNSSGGNPTPTSEPLTFEFILEEIEAYLKDDSISSEIDHANCDPKGDICLIEKLLNNDPFQLPPIDLKQGEVIKAKPSIEEPQGLELKVLPSHLEYAYLEENNKLPVIIAKGLKDDEKDALLKVLKSHKRAIAWKITDIKGIDPCFCTHKILMEDDYKPTVQSQRRVNPKIHEVIKKEVLKLLDAGMIYPIFDSPWVSPVHCVPKKGGITVVANEENELIPTRLVTGWRVCIDYRKLNEATRKDHFPLPFMDQMLERLAGNEFYCFLDGFSRTHFLIPASMLFIFLLLSRWHLKVKWKIDLPFVSSPKTNEFGDRVKLCDSVTKNKALRGRHPMLIPIISSFLISKCDG
ncbi:hypothetical protein Tco_0001212 [Tanacetum coccineum]